MSFYSTIQLISGHLSSNITMTTLLLSSPASFITSIIITMIIITITMTTVTSHTQVYINPGGDAYSQLSSMGQAGRDHIISFVQRDQHLAPSAYVGFCAGGYIAAHDYLWETMYEGPGYYNFEQTPPLSLFPFSVEGSLVEINDDQFGDQSGSKFRLVNVSNGQQMLYYGGSSFGYSGTGDPSDSHSALYDPEVQVLVYYSDFYGFQTSNLPAAWRYRNAVMTSVHPEADNCTCTQDSDCPPPGTIPTETILQNRAWLCHYINEAAQSSFRVPVVPVEPVFDTTPPHTHTPAAACYSTSAAGVPEGRGQLLFCDGFDSVDGAVPFGLAPQFQRNQTDYNRAQPWNTSYLSSWGLPPVQYATAQGGDGYAIAAPQAPVSHVSTITTKAISTEHCSTTSSTTSSTSSDSVTEEEAVTVSFYVQGQTLSSGSFAVQYLWQADADSVVDPFSAAWRSLAEAPLQPPLVSWEHRTLRLPLSWRGGEGDFLRVQFQCAAGVAAENYCAIDTLSVSC
jgi:glutamine amidotransferase-like uncharacterized protein